MAEWRGIRTNAQKKDASSAEGRRLLSIMASRLYHDTQIIAENATMGKFPSLDPIAVTPEGVDVLQKRLHAMVQWEKMKQADILASAQSKTGGDR
jgi:hypothetical protein